MLNRSVGAPPSVLVGIAVSESLERIFDTLSTSRKVVNIHANPAVSIVIGGLDGIERGSSPGALFGSLPAAYSKT